MKPQRLSSLLFFPSYFPAVCVEGSWLCFVWLQRFTRFNSALPSQAAVQCCCRRSEELVLDEKCFSEGPEDYSDYLWMLISSVFSKLMSVLISHRCISLVPHSLLLSPLTIIIALNFGCTSTLALQCCCALGGNTPCCDCHT